jgi:hypothetical protein
VTSAAWEVPPAFPRYERAVNSAFELMIAVRNRLSFKNDPTSIQFCLLTFAVYIKVPLESLFVRGQKLIQRTLIVAYQIVVIIVILLVNFYSDELILFEIVVSLEKLDEVWVEVVPNCFGFSEAVPGHFIFAFEEHHCERVRLTDSCV